MIKRSRSGRFALPAPFPLSDRLNTAVTHAPRVKPSAAFGRHFDFRAARFHLRQRGKVVVVLRQIRVVNGAIMLRHGKGGMSQ